MKKKFKSFALILLMCGTIVSAWADGVDTNYIIKENFSGIGTGYKTEYNNWTLKSCKGVDIGNNRMIRIEDLTTSSSGYAITPALGYAGNILLVFSQGKNPSNESAKIKFKIEGGGTIKDNGKTSIAYTITNDASSTEDLLTTQFIIENVQSNTKVNFQIEKVENTFKSVYIDDVKIIKLGDLTLDETIDSSEPIEANNGTVCEVHTNRTLTGGIWNTMCLPFNVKKSQLESVLGANQDIQLRTYTGYANKVMTFEPATSVAAGTPFLIKLNTTVVNPAFTGDNKVTIVNTPAQSVTHNGVSFVGTYGPVDLQTDGSEMFITKSSNMLSVPAAASNKMYGMRAFIRVTGGVFPARIVVGDDETTDLSTAIMAEEQDKKVYDLNGQQVMHPKRGLYIVNNKITFLK